MQLYTVIFSGVQGSRRGRSRPLLGHCAIVRDHMGQALTYGVRVRRRGVGVGG